MNNWRLRSDCGIALLITGGTMVMVQLNIFNLPAFCCKFWYFLNISSRHNADNGCQGKVSLLFNIFHPQLQHSTITVTDC